MRLATQELAAFITSVRAGTCRTACSTAPPCRRSTDRGGGRRGCDCQRCRHAAGPPQRCSAPVRCRPGSATCAAAAPAALLATAPPPARSMVDDGHRGASGHAGAAIVPAVFTVDPSADGLRLLTAIVLGYDVALRVAAAQQPGTVESFASGRWCGYGVAAALGWLQGLDAGQLAHALAIAGAEAPQNLPQGACRMSSVEGQQPHGEPLTALGAVARAARRRPPARSTCSIAPRSTTAAPCSPDGRALAHRGHLPQALCVLPLHPSRARRRARAPAATRPAARIDRRPDRRDLSRSREDHQRSGAGDPGGGAVQHPVLYRACGAARRARAAPPGRGESALRGGPGAVAARDGAVLRGVRRPVSAPYAGTRRVHPCGRETSATVMHPLGDVQNPMQRRDVEAKLRDLGQGLLSTGAIQSIIAGADRLRAGTRNRS